MQIQQREVFIRRPLKSAKRTLLTYWGYKVSRAGLRLAWLYPVRDLLGLLAWSASYLNVEAVRPDKNYQLAKDGKTILRQAAHMGQRPRTSD